MSKVTNIELTARSLLAGSEIATRREQDALDIAAFIDAFEFADTESPDPVLHRLVNKRGGLKLQLTRIEQDLIAYPYLYEACKKSPAICRAIILAEAAFGDDRRKFSGNRKIHHTLRGANRAAELFGIDSVAEIITYLMHDLVEDTNMRNAEIESIFGRDVASAVDLLTIIRETSADPYQDIFLKQAAKTAQAHALKPYPNLVVLKAIDNADAQASDERDFGKGSLYINGDEVRKGKDNKSAGSINVFKLKQWHCADHHREYMTILREGGIQTLNGRQVDYSAVAKIIDDDYGEVETKLTRLLVTGAMANCASTASTPSGKTSPEILSRRGLLKSISKAPSRAAAAAVTVFTMAQSGRKKPQP